MSFVISWLSSEVLGVENPPVPWTDVGEVMDRRSVQDEISDIARGLRNGDLISSMDKGEMKRVASKCDLWVVSDGVAHVVAKPTKKYVLPSLVAGELSGGDMEKYIVSFLSILMDTTDDRKAIAVHATVEIHELILLATYLGVRSEVRGSFLDLVKELDLVRSNDSFEALSAPQTPVMVEWSRSVEWTGIKSSLLLIDRFRKSYMRQLMASGDVGFGFPAMGQAATLFLEKAMIVESVVNSIANLFGGFIVRSNQSAWSGRFREFAMRHVIHILHRYSSPSMMALRSVSAEMKVGMEDIHGWDRFGLYTPLSEPMSEFLSRARMVPCPGADMEFREVFFNGYLNKVVR